MFKRKFLVMLFCIMLAALVFPLTAFAASESESNNTCGTATPISVNQDVTGNISEDGDTDWYSFSLKNAGYISVDFSHPDLYNSNRYWEVTIYRSDGTTTYNGTGAHWDITGDGNLTTPQLGIGAGEYYVKICKDTSYPYNYNTATYTFKVNFTASNYWEKEINSGASSATPISVNTSYKGAISDGNDVDWYRFELSNAGYISVDFSHPDLYNSNRYWEVTIYRSDGTTTYNGTGTHWDITGNGNLSTPQIGLNAGRYFIKINNDTSYPYYHNTNTYTLNVNFTASNYWEKEINSTAANATPIAVNANYKGSISDGDDVDWYKFELSKDGYIVLKFNHPDCFTTDKYWGVNIYRSDGTTTYDGAGWSWMVNGSENLETMKIGLNAGTYFIKINDDYSYPYYYNTNTYTLNVNFTESNYWEKEINSGASSATTISTNKNYSGSISSGDDKDWYSVKISTAGYYDFNFSHPELSSADTYWYMNVYESDGTTNLLGESCAVAGNSNHTRSDVYLDEGTYFIKVTPYSSSRWDSATYTLKVSAGDMFQITYHNNYSGAADEFDSQTITSGESAKVISDIPERAKYTFLGWSTSSTATSASYKPGQSLSVTADKDLYAVWKAPTVIEAKLTSSSYTASVPFVGGYQYYKFKPEVSGKYRFESTGDIDSRIYLYNPSMEQLAWNDDGGDGTNFLLTYDFKAGATYYLKVSIYSSGTGTVKFTGKRIYTVKFNANGGENAPSTQLKKHGTTLKLSSQEPTRTGYYFLGWSSDKNATTPKYKAGDSFTANSNASFYAVWSNSSLKITTQPKKTFAASGKVASVSVAATGEGLTYQWYVCEKGNTSYVKSSIKDSTYSYSMTAAKSGRKVYCVVTDKYGNQATSKVVTMSLLAITKQPANATAASGKGVSATVTAAGDGLTYQWYACEPGKTKFYKSSTTTNKYSYAMTSEKSGRKAYCVVTDKYGNSVTSKTVTLSLLAITKQPANASVASGKAASTSVTAAGSGLKYQWYVCEKGSTTYTKSSITGSTYSFNMTAEKSGRKVYCVVTDKFGNKVKSETATLSMVTPVKITKQPVSASAASGKLISASVTATGSGLKYQWYVCEKGNTTYTKSSITDSTYSFTMTAEKSGRKVYCVVTDKLGNKVKSNTATLTMVSPAKITKQPANASALSGKVVSTSVTATGSGLKYQWYVCEKGNTTYTKSSITDSTYSFTMSSAKSGRKVYCVVTDKYGNKVKSNTATLTMVSPAKITKQPVSAFAASGKVISTSVTATGSGLKYQWYVCEPGKTTYVKSSITDSTYSFTMTAAKDGRKVYCVVTDKYGNKVTSNKAVLSMS